MTPEEERIVVLEGVKKTAVSVQFDGHSHTDI